MTSAEFAANRRTIGLTQSDLGLLMGAGQTEIARLETTREPTKKYAAMMRSLLLLHRHGMIPRLMAEIMELTA